ncbi:MAG: L-threonylcarbamoyladenylate synthase [Dinoroseobacter sp.]|nr:L-threonylcarbamoyladenylate synthase [Dinoroseobacter sp.]
MCRKTLRLSPDPKGISRAADILRSGGLVAFPTETVYGLGGDARNAAAVARIYEAKRRPPHNPLIAHVAGINAARRLAQFDPRAEALATAFWPGALTLVLPVRADSRLTPAMTPEGAGTVALRVPKHPVAQALLTAFGGPIAAPSANPSGRVSPTSADHVLEGLSGRIDAVLDGGDCPVGLESTILSLVTPQARLLRPGGIATEAIAEVLGGPVASGKDTGVLTAPGQLASHYAPHAPMRLNAEFPLDGEIWLGFGPDCTAAEVTLSATGDLDEAAANLFAALRLLDARAKGRRIAVAPIPDYGIGEAINDRLCRAAAPRDST